MIQDLDCIKRKYPYRSVEFALEEVLMFLNPPKKKHKGVTTKPKHPRNALCHCGSGKKYKKCCM
jgi:uncharacterized protein YchJ